MGGRLDPWLGCRELISPSALPLSLSVLKGSEGARTERQRYTTNRKVQAIKKARAKEIQRQTHQRMRSPGTQARAGTDRAARRR